MCPPARRRARARRAGRSRAESRRRLEPPQRVARDLAVVERKGAAGDLLTLLVSLARDDDDVAIPGGFERTLDRAPPVELDVEVAIPRDSGSDLRGILAPRI